MTIHGLTLRPHDVVRTVSLRPPLDALRVEWARRQDRPRLALIAVPLAMNATGLVGLWWTWPVLVAGAAACTPAWRWSWVLTFQLGAIGTQWAYVGAIALAVWPDHRVLVGVVWTGGVLALGLAGDFNRRYHDLRGRRVRT